MVFLIRLALLLLIFAPVKGFAAQPLIYAPLSDDLRLKSIASFLLESGALAADLPYDVAPADLNNDGIDEMIFRQQSTACETRSNCIYLVAGVSRKQPILLATFKARKIGISEEKSYGVKKILVYDEKQNDFQYITYVWDPYKSSFAAQ